MQRKLTLIALFLALVCGEVAGQSPINNRIEAFVRKLPGDASVAARYTDRYRHCVYYVENGRLYRFDVCADRREEIRFPKGYLKILHTCVGHQGRILFVAVDRGALCGNYAVGGQVLYAIDTYGSKMWEVASGFSVNRERFKRQTCLTVKKAHHCVDPVRKRWQAQNFHYDLTGAIVYTSEPYIIRIERKR